MKNDVLKIIKSTMDEYKDEFVYLDPLDIEFIDNMIKGEFKFTGAAYMNVYNKILNNTEAMFIFNQAQYILLAAIMLEEQIINVDNLEDAYLKLDGIVYKDMSFDFKKSITDYDKLNFVCSAEPYLDNKGRTRYVVKLDLVNGAFEVTGTAVCLNKSIHVQGL